MTTNPATPMPVEHATCWCGTIATFVVPVDVCVSNPSHFVIHGSNQEPVQAVCDTHTRDGWTRLNPQGILVEDPEDGRLFRIGLDVAALNLCAGSGQPLAVGGTCRTCKAAFSWREFVGIVVGAPTPEHATRAYCSEPHPLDASTTCLREAGHDGPHDPTEA